MNLRHFPIFKKNYPFYPFLILRIILFSVCSPHFALNLATLFRFQKDRKRIKTSEGVEYIVDIVFVGQVCPTYLLFSCLFWKICLKLGLGVNFSKDRKRIKISELVEYIVDLVFVGQVCPTDKPTCSPRGEGTGNYANLFLL